MPRAIFPATAGPLGDELAALAATLARVTVRLRGAPGAEGCGVAWTDELVVSNAHVVRDSGALARLPDGGTRDLRVVARDPELDLVALAAPGATLERARLGTPETLRAGELVVALGCPLGVPDAVALGVVHHVTRDQQGVPRWIGADLRLAPGNSGGPLAGVDGRVLGINTLVANGLGYAVSVQAVERFLREAA